MKLIIDIPEMAYDAYKEWHKNKVATVEQSIIANGIPYEEKPQGDTISREALKEAFSNNCLHNCYYCKLAKWDKKGACYNCGLIDNAPLVNPCDNCEEKKKLDYLCHFSSYCELQALRKFKEEHERPQGDIRWTDKIFIKSSGDIVDFEGRVVGHINLEDMVVRNE